MAGRQVVAIVGAHFLPRCMDLDSFVLFIVKVQQNTTQNCTVLYCTVQCNAVQHCKLGVAWTWTPLSSSLSRYSRVQYSTVLYSAVECSAVL